MLGWFGGLLLLFYGVLPFRRMHGEVSTLSPGTTTINHRTRDGALFLADLLFLST